MHHILSSITIILIGTQVDHSHSTSLSDTDPINYTELQHYIM